MCGGKEVSLMNKYFKRAEKYFSKHFYMNALIHTAIGIGIGILVTYPLVGEHPVRWGVALIVVGVLGHFLPFMEK